MFNQLSLTTGARIHFGLLEINEQTPGCYGGIGLMIEEPTIRLVAQWGATSLDEVAFDVPVVWRDRIKKVFENWTFLGADTTGSDSALAGPPEDKVVPVRRIHLDYDEPAHQGLGSGTQVSSLAAHSLWMAQRLVNLDGRDSNGDSAADREIDASMLSQISQRGLRSHIGLSGYLSGGFIVDPGRDESASASSSLPTVGRSVARYDFPDWPVLLIQNPSFSGEHGDVEKDMFRICAANPNFNRERMLELIQDDLVPAIESGDWHRWDRCIGEYGHLAGMIFRDVQSGIFRSQAIRQVVEKLHQLGCQGACQSSWGPAVAVVAQDVDHALGLQTELQAEFPELRTRVTRARNCGNRNLERAF